MAAQRLDLRQRGLQAAGLRPARHTPNMDLLGQMFDPGMFYTGFRPDSTQNMPLEAGALGTLKAGGKAGLSAFDSLFDQSGRVSDPAGLLRALNAGNILGYRPTVGAAQKYGTYPQGFTPPIPHAGLIPPAQQGQPVSARPELMEWVRSLGLARSGEGSVGYDPTNIRYGDYSLAPGLNLQTANRQQLEDWAQSQYGVDLLTLAASPTALLEARQKYMADPSQIYDPTNPGMLRRTAIPGLDAETSAARMGAYTQGVSSAQDEAARQREARLGGQLTELLRTNPEAMRTGFGRQLGMTADYAGAASRAASGQTPQPYDYSLQYQSALLPDLIQRAIQAAMGGF